MLLISQMIPYYKITSDTYDLGWLVVFYVPSTARSFRNGITLKFPLGNICISAHFAIINLNLNGYYLSFNKFNKYSVA